jgi:hypothetical protein
MWGTVMGIALFMSFNPLLLGFILLVISRPRPLQNLFAFWVGCLIVNIPVFLVPLVVLQINPSLTTLAQDLSRPAPGSSVQPLQTGLGVLALLTAAVMIRRARARQRATLPTPGGSNSSVAVLDLDKSTAMSRALARLQKTRVISAIRRLLSRTRNAWESGSSWVSVLFGLGYVAPPPTILLVVLIIVGSGASIGTQVSAAIAFVFGVLAILEITLVSYLIAPRRTKAVLEPAHEWALVHRGKVLITLFVAAGAWAVVTGVGII